MATDTEAAREGCLIRTKPPLKSGLVVYTRPQRTSPRKYSPKDLARIVRYVRCSATDREIICAVLDELDGGRLLLDLLRRIVGTWTGNPVAAPEKAMGAVTAQAAVTAAVPLLGALRAILETLQTAIARIKASWLWRVFGRTIIVRMVLGALEGAIGVILAVLGFFDTIEELLETLKSIYCEPEETK